MTHLALLIAAVLDRAADVEVTFGPCLCGRVSGQLDAIHKVRTTIRALSHATLAAELGHLVPGADEVERLRAEIDRLQTANITQSRELSAAWQQVHMRDQRIAQLEARDGIILIKGDTP